MWLWWETSSPGANRFPSGMFHLEFWKQHPTWSIGGHQCQLRTRNWRYSACWCLHLDEPRKPQSCLHLPLSPQYHHAMSWKDLFASRLTPHWTCRSPYRASDHLLSLEVFPPWISILARSNCASCSHSPVSTRPSQPSMRATHPSCSSAAQTHPCTAKHFAVTIWLFPSCAAASYHWLTSTSAKFDDLFLLRTSKRLSSGPQSQAPENLQGLCCNQFLMNREDHSHGCIGAPKLDGKNAHATCLHLPQSPIPPWHLELNSRNVAGWTLVGPTTWKGHL